MKTNEQLYKKDNLVYSSSLISEGGNQDFSYNVIDTNEGETPYKIYTGEIKVAEFKTLTFAIKFIYHTHWELVTKYFDKK